MMGPFEGKKYFISIEIIYKDVLMISAQLYATHITITEIRI